MDVLKKVKSATLIEAVVATVLIVIVFIVASLVLNNLVLNTYSNNTHAIENRLNELEYDIQNNTVKLPYDEQYKEWQIEIKKEIEVKATESKVRLIIEAKNEKNNKSILRQHGNFQD